MVNYYLYRIGQAMALSLPLRLGYFLARLFSDIRYLFARQDRRIVTENLKAIFPEKTDREIAQIRIRLFRNFAKYLVDFFRFEKINQGYIKKYIRFENLLYLQEAIASDKGVILLTAHLGNWELGGAVIAQSGYPLWAVALPHKQKKVNDFFNFQRERKDVHVIPMGNAPRKSLELLKKKALVALVGDRNFNEGGITVEFFGKKTSFPEGPAVFARRTGAVILPGFMVRNADDTFTLKFEKPMKAVSSGAIVTDLKTIVAGYMAIYEEYIRRYPDQWYMFRRFWQS